MEPFSDSEYRPFPEKGSGELTSEPPPRYKPKTTDPEKQARAQARAEARRTRRTQRLQQQEEQRMQLKEGGDQQHYKLDTIGDSSEESSVDENFDVDSIAESETENLT